eukprot:14280662-Ditylum_brightwellii.AAC.1
MGKQEPNEKHHLTLSKSYLSLINKSKSESGLKARNRTENDHHDLVAKIREKRPLQLKSEYLYGTEGSNWQFLRKQNYHLVQERKRPI